MKLVGIGFPLLLAWIGGIQALVLAQSLVRLWRAVYMECILDHNLVININQWISLMIGNFKKNMDKYKGFCILFNLQN